MKVYFEPKNIEQIPTPNNSKNNSSKNLLLNEIYLKEKKKKEMLMEEKINNIVNDINQKLSEGKKLLQISILEVKDLNNIIDYILNKNSRKPNDIIILRQFLASFSNFIEILSLHDKFIDTSDLLFKIASFLKKEEIPKNEILFLNGQLGKKFYLILDGEVSVLIPIQYSVNITLTQFYQYMEFLLDNKEYELLRKTFNDNSKLLEEKNVQNYKEYEKFKKLLDINLPAEAYYDPTMIDNYMNKFTIFINNILKKNAILEEEEKRKAEEKEEEDSEEEEEEEEEKEQDHNENSDRDSFDLSSIHKYNKKEKIKKKKSIDKNKFNFIKYNFFLWKYFMVCNLEKGKSFGEVALQKGDKRRTATIITRTECIFGVLEKDEYQVLVKEYMEKARKINTDALLHTKLFLNYREDLFDIHYFNCFKAMKVQKSEYLFKQKEKREYIYFIKKGDVQIELFCSWDELNKILDSQVKKIDFKNKKKFNELIISNEKLKSFCQKKQKFNISIYSSGEIVGFEDHIFPGTNTFMFSAICMSECQIFSLEIRFIEKMIREKILRTNYKELIIEKKEKLIQRLSNLKSNIFYQYNNMIDDKNLFTRKKEKKTKIIYYNNKFKNKNILKIKKKGVFFPPGIKTEINNFSVDKKNINQDINKDSSISSLKKFGIQNRNSLLFSSIIKRHKALNLQSEKSNYQMTNTYSANDSDQSLKGTKIKFMKTENNLFRLNNPILNISIKGKNKIIKNQKINPQSYRKRKIRITFPIKGKVPKLLIERASTVNKVSKVIDELISKEKELSDNRKSRNETDNKKEHFSKKNSTYKRKFISHLELLVFDKLINDIEIKNKEKSNNNSRIENSKSFGKLKLLPLNITQNNKYNFNFEKK